MLITYQTCMFRSCFFFFVFTAVFQIYCFSCGKRNVCVPGSHGTSGFSSESLSLCIYSCWVFVLQVLNLEMGLTWQYAQGTCTLPFLCLCAKAKQMYQIWFSLSLCHLNESEFFLPYRFSFASVALGPVFSPCSFVCVWGSVVSAFLFCFHLSLDGNQEATP